MPWGARPGERRGFKHSTNTPRLSSSAPREIKARTRTVYHNFTQRHQNKTKFGTPRRPSQLNANPGLGRMISTVLWTDNNTTRGRTCAPPSSIDPMDTNTINTSSFNKSVGYSPDSRTSVSPASPSQTTSAPARGSSTLADSQTLSSSSGNSYSIR